MMPKYKKVRRLELDRESLPRVTAWTAQARDSAQQHTHDEYLRRDGTTTLTGSWDAGDSFHARFSRLIVGGAAPYPISPSLGISVLLWAATRLYDPDRNFAVRAYIQGAGTTTSPVAGSAIAFSALVSASARDTSSPFSHESGVAYHVEAARGASSASLDKFYGLYLRTQDFPRRRWAIYGEPRSGSVYLPETACLAGFELSDRGWLHAPAAAASPDVPAAGGYLWVENGSPLWMGPDGEVHNLAASLGSGYLDGIYVRRDGTTPLTGSWNAGSPGIHITGCGLALGPSAVLGGENWLDLRGRKAAPSGCVRGIFVEVKADDPCEAVRGLEVRPVYAGTTSAGEGTGLYIHPPVAETLGATLSRTYGAYVGGSPDYSLYTEGGLAYLGGDLRAVGRLGLGTLACPTDVVGNEVYFQAYEKGSGSSVEIFRLEGDADASVSWYSLLRLIGHLSTGSLASITLLDLSGSVTAAASVGEFYSILVNQPGGVGTHYAFYAANGLVYVAESGCVSGSWQANYLDGKRRLHAGWNAASALWTWAVYENGNAALGGTGSELGGGRLVVGYRNAAASPASPLSDGGLFWSQGGKPFWMDTAGSVYDLTQGAGAGGFDHLDVLGGGRYTRSASLAGAGNLYVTEAGSVIRYHDSACPTYSRVTTDDLAVNNRLLSNLIPWEPGQYTLGYSTSPFYEAYVGALQAGSPYMRHHLRKDGVYAMNESLTADPTASASNLLLYVKTDHHLYARTATGSVLRLTRPRVKRSFGWYVNGSATVDVSQGPIYRLDARSDLLWVVLNAKTAPTSGSFAVDVKRSTDYGSWSSVLAACASIPAGAHTGSSNSFSVSTLEEGEWIRLDVESAEGAADVTIQIWLETEAEQ